MKTTDQVAVESSVIVRTSASTSFLHSEKQGKGSAEDQDRSIARSGIDAMCPIVRFRARAVASGQDHLHLTVVKGYLAKLLGNARVVRYLMLHWSEFQAIADMTSTLPPEAAA